MSQQDSTIRPNPSDNRPATGENVRDPDIDLSWLSALPHFLGAFSIFSAYCGFLLPLFFWLAKKDEDEIIAAECRKALNFQGAYLVFYLIFSVTLQLAETFAPAHPETVLIFKPLGHVSIVASLLVFGYSLVAGYKVYNGRDAKYPMGVDLISLFARKRQRG